MCAAAVALDLIDHRVGLARGSAIMEQHLSPGLSEGRIVPPFLQQPDLLLRDEPTNHLDAESILGGRAGTSSFYLGRTGCR